MAVQSSDEIVRRLTRVAERTKQVSDAVRQQRRIQSGAEPDPTPTSVGNIQRPPPSIIPPKG